MPRPPAYRYISPTELRKRLAWHEMEIAAIKLTLDAIGRGEWVMLGDAPDGAVTFTGPHRAPDPFTRKP